MRASASSSLEDVLFADADCIAWFDRAHFTRGQATSEWVRLMWQAEWGPRRDLYAHARCRLRWMKRDGFCHPDEGMWVECDRDDPEAVAYWRVESVREWGKSAA